MLPEDSPLSKLALVGLALLTVTSGCSAAMNGEMTADEVSDQIEEQHDDIESYEATVVTTLEQGGNETVSEREVVAKPKYGMHRSEGVDDETGNRTITVTNGTVSWFYQESENTVRRFNGTGSATARPMNYTALVERVTEDYEVTLSGSETVNDRETYVLELTAKNDSDVATTERTYWIDKDWWFPVKSVSEMEYGNETATVTTEYRNLSFNTGVPNSTFAFDPPANATVETTEVPTIETFESREDAADAVDFALPEPDLPDDFAFESASVTRDDGNVTASLQYENESNHVRVTKQDTPTYEASGDAENVTVGDVDGTYRSLGETGIVRWNCGDFGYTVAGDLPKDDLVEIAESIDCGDD